MCFTVEEGNEILDSIQSGNYFKRVAVIQQWQLQEYKELVETKDIEILVLKGEVGKYKNEVSYLNDQLKIANKNTKKKAVKNTIRDVGRYALIVSASIGIGLLIAQ